MGPQILIQCIRLSVFALLITACSAEPDPRPRDEAASTQSSLTSAPSFTISLPAGVMAGSLAISADGILLVQDRAVIRSANGSPAAVANAGPAIGQTQIGLSASLGNVTSVPSVVVGSGTVVSGNITSAGSVVLFPSANVTGTDSSNSASLTPVTTLSWTAPNPGPAMGDVTILSGSNHLVPGNYGNLTVGLGATVTLDRGNYYFSTVNLLPGSTLTFNGATVLYVTVNFLYQGSITDTVGSGSLLVAYSGVLPVNLNAPFTGTVVAPNATVFVTTSSAGTFYGQNVQVAPGSVVTAQTFPLPPSPCVGEADGTACGVSGNICASGSCIGNASATFTPSAAAPLPAPPMDTGCYLATLNGWLQVECANPADVFSGFQNFQVGDDGVTTTPQPFSGGSAVPLVYGQVESTVVTIGSEMSNQTPNQWSVQNNTNDFPCSTQVNLSCGVQFTVATDGQGGKSAVCVTNVNVSTQDYTITCVGVNGQNVTTTNGQTLGVTTRVGPLQAFDFANVAGYSFQQPSGASAVAVVAQFSWVSSQDVVPTSETDVPNRIPGLYAVVAPDLYGLAGNWTDVTGGILGIDGGQSANFTNAEVLTRVVASNCPGDVSASGPTCPGAPTLSSSNVSFTVSPDSTKETDNLNLVQQPALAFPNANMVTTEVLGSTAPTSGNLSTCLSSAPNHLFIKDNEGDIGGVPSNVGGVPFWESPDIFIVPQNAPTPGLNDIAADLELTANTQYNVFLRVHNDYGCNAVNGPLNVFIDGADPNMGFTNWSQVTPGAASGQYATFGPAGMPVVPAFGAAIIGPFPWTPSDGGHKCLLAAIAAGAETEPPTSTQPGHSVLPPAYSSNQIAQRNVQIGSSCTYDIGNTSSASANLLLGLSVTPATPTPGTGGGPTISLTFDDPSSVFFNQWNGQSGISVSNSGGSTTVVLNSSYVALNSVPLSSGQSPSVNINIDPGNASPPTVNVSAILTDPMTGNILQENGGTCTSTGESTVIPK
jgi:hypothetical protein